MELEEQLIRRLQQLQSPPTSHHGLTIVITGANSGIGLAAARLLIQMNPLHRIVLACRTIERANYAKEQVCAAIPKQQHNRDSTTDHIIPLSCDHTSMSSIREFNTALRRRLDETYTPSKWLYNGIDVLCCNAAVLVSGGDSDTSATTTTSNVPYTNDDIEVTFQTNYLSVFQLVNLTLDILNPNARIVMTTSGLYERETLSLQGMIAVDPIASSSSSSQHNVVVQKRFPTIDGSPFHFKRNYAKSKLCVVAFCAELERRLQQRHNGTIRVNCFSPGLMLSSGLFRNQDETKHAAGLHPDIVAKQKPVIWGAGAMVYMALGIEPGVRSGQYWRDADSTLGIDSIYGQHFCPTDIREQFDRTTCQQLWDLSCQLTDIPQIDPDDDDDDNV